MASRFKTTYTPNFGGFLLLSSPRLVPSKSTHWLLFGFPDRDVLYEDAANVYEVKVYSDFPHRLRAFLPDNSLVEFTKAEDAQDLELPGAVLLDCHYRLAEILNASGMAKIIVRYL